MQLASKSWSLIGFETVTRAQKALRGPTPDSERLLFPSHTRGLAELCELRGWFWVPEASLSPGERGLGRAHR